MTIDIDAIRRKWLAQCGPCDAGLPMECSHPDADYRPVMAALCDELEQVRESARYYSALVADLADKLHKADAQVHSLEKATTAYANEVAAKDKVVEAAKAWVEAEVADYSRTGDALIAAVENLAMKSEVTP